MRLIIIMTATISLVTTPAIAEEYVCTPDNPATEFAYKSKVFKLIVSDKCLKLSSLSSPHQSWSWKVTSKDSLGNKEGFRRFCEKDDDGLIGNPAVWRQGKRTLIAFSERDGKNTFSCQEFSKRNNQ